MISRRVFWAAIAGACLALAALALRTSPGVAASNLPAELSNQEFWRLSTSLSEAGGTFHSDNFVSNESRFQTVIPDLLDRVRQGGLYVGVGPEQNFTYIAALEPRMAFIVDLRRGNLQEHLLYKALFEMSRDRVEFLARLFSRERPAGLGPDARIEEIFAALDGLAASEALYRSNLQAVTDWLVRHRGLPLDQEDVEGIEYIYRTAFFADGPDLNYRLTGQGRRLGHSAVPTYAELMTSDDGDRRQRGFLVSEASFVVVKTLHQKNLIVPVVGDFGGSKALRGVGEYARDHAATVTAFYVSNVEQYLRRDGTWEAFCRNVAAMPLDRASTFIRSARGGRSWREGFSLFTTSLGRMQVETRSCGNHPEGDR
jgi:hypothetical protein